MISVPYKNDIDINHQALPLIATNQWEHWAVLSQGENFLYVRSFSMRTANSLLPNTSVENKLEPKIKVSTSYSIVSTSHLM